MITTIILNEDEVRQACSEFFLKNCSFQKGGALVEVYCINVVVVDADDDEECSRRVEVRILLESI